VSLEQRSNGKVALRAGAPEVSDIGCSRILRLRDCYQSAERAFPAFPAMTAFPAFPAFPAFLYLSFRGTQFVDRAAVVVRDEQ
jgi:hypothetical protein